MQRGTIVRHRGHWTLRYYDVQFRDGKKTRVRASKKLAPFGKEYPTESSVRHLADDILAPLNRRQLQPESSLLLTEFIETRYFPAVERELRPSTVLNYRVSVYNKHLKDRLGKIRVRDFRTVHAQRLLREIPDVGHGTLLHVKNFLSGVFKFAKREGVIDGVNPVQDSSAPGRSKKFSGGAYTIDDVQRMLEEIKDETAGDVIALLSLTGLRQSEARGLRWSDWDEGAETLSIARSVWRKHVGPTKNPMSEDVIPVLPLLRDLLIARRDRIKPRPKPEDYIFAGTRRGAPLDFHNLVNRVIKPALKDVDVIKWAGLHGFRRGLASNLFDLGVNPKVIAAILRHGSMAITLQHYIRTPEAASREAMQKLEAKIRAKSTDVIGDQS